MSDESKKQKLKDISRLYTTTPSMPDDPEGIREYFMNIINLMPNNVYWLDRNCVTMGCNKNVLDLVGVDKLEDFVGINYEQMGELAGWEEGQAMSFQKDDMEVMESEKPKLNVHEPPLYDKNGDPVYYVSSRVPIYDNDKKVIGVVGISVDSTETIVANKKLESALRQCEDIVASINNKLRNTIHSISMTLSKIEEDPKKAKECVSDIRFIMSDVLPLLTFASHVTRLDSGRLSLNLSSTNIKGKINTVIENNYHKCKPGVDIYSYYHDPEEYYFVKSDPEHLNNVLNTVIDNAIKYTNSGSIEISAEKFRFNADKYVRISVKDDGVGIPKDMLDKLFTTEAYESTLFGRSLKLAYCRKMIRDMGGTFSIASEENIGTVATIVLPLVTVASIDQPSDVSALSLNCLVVDANERRALATSNQLINSKTDVLHSLNQLLDKKNLDAYDAVLIDESVFDAASFSECYAQFGNGKTHFLIACSSSTNFSSLNLGVYVQLLHKPLLSDSINERIREHIVKKKVLLVEDDQTAQWITKEILEEFGYVVTAVSSGEEALDLDVATYNAVLMDIGLPGHTGLKTTELLAEKYGEGLPPVMAVTGMTMSIDENDLQDSGLFADILIKPVPVQLMISRLAELLSNHE